MIRRVLYWVSILLLQFLVLNHLDLSPYVLPQVFIILLITLPIPLHRNFQILIAFFLGLLADIFAGTPGIHASGCLWLALLRIFLLSTQDLKQQEANKQNYTYVSAGLMPFFYTTLLLVVLYHLYVFTISSLGATNGINLLMTTIISSSVSLTFIILIQYIYVPGE